MPLDTIAQALLDEPTLVSESLVVRYLDMCLMGMVAVRG